MIGSKFELNKRTYVLIKEETKGRCTGCVFEDIHCDDSNLCSLVYSTTESDDEDTMCQSFNAIFAESFPEVIKGVKRKLTLN